LIGGFYQPFKPMEGKFRDGVSLNGDEDGNNDHSANGRYRAPPSKPYSAEYQAGGVANFEYDITTPHGGYLQFFLCDVSSTGGDLERSTFQSGNCYLLERAYNVPCESGNDPECGPIDPKFPSRWYLPCRVSDSLDQNQILGGSNGKMSYKIPNVAIKQGVIMSYWLVSSFYC
jgi:Lytic polysaccharide mono-oxygenase, cellulose-degrading